MMDADNMGQLAQKIGEVCDGLPAAEVIGALLSIFHLAIDSGDEEFRQVTLKFMEDFVKFERYEGALMQETGTGMTH